MYVCIGALKDRAELWREMVKNKELEIGDFVSLIRPYKHNYVNLLNEDHITMTNIKFNYGEVALILAADENPHCYIIIRCYKVLCQQGIGWIGESWLKKI